MAQTMVQRGFEADTAFAHENMLTIKVGCSGTDVFMVPEDRIRGSSEFVDTAMRGPWKESQERSIALPDFNKLAFGIYLHWLLTGVVHSKGNLRGALIEEILLLSSLFELGHYLLDTDFRDSLSDALMQCISELQSSTVPFSPAFGTSFYLRIPYGSPTRMLVADLTAWTMDDLCLANMAKMRDPMHPDYARDLVFAMARRHVSKPPNKSPLVGWKTNCKYHCHGDEKPCYRKKARMSSNLTKKRSVADDAELPTAKKQT